MKRNVLAGAGLAVVGLALVLACRGWAQAPPYAGLPGVGGSPAGQAPAYLPTSPPLTGQPAKISRIPEEWRKPQEDPDINRDLFVTPEAGPWLLYVYSYDDVDGPSLARALALELRGPNYKLNAYVYNYGDKERKEEQERVRLEMERRKEALLRAGASGYVSIRVPHMRLRVQCAVLVGGYKDKNVALRELERIKKLRPLDPARFKLPDMFVIEVEQSRAKKGERAAVNPFLRAFPVQNPSVDFAKVPRDVQDLAMLRKLNAGESYSLLNCPKTWTLAVKQFQVPTVVQTAGDSSGFLHKMGLGGSGEKKDAAKVSAHNLAKLLHEGGWDAYVLHTRFYSMVTVGGYDSDQDPRIPPHQEALAKLNPRLAAVAPVDLQLLPRAIPIPVPR
jgi:hypothetical protein